MNNILYFTHEQLSRIVDERINNVRKIMKPIYKTPMRISRKLFSRNQLNIRKMFEIGENIHINSYSLTYLIRHTIRRIEQRSGNGFFALLETTYENPFNPKVYVTKSWVKVLHENKVLALSVIAHELFHFFYSIRYGMLDQDILVLHPVADSIEEISALKFEEIIIKNIKDNLLVSEALKDIHQKIFGEEKVLWALIRASHSK